MNFQYNFLNLLEENVIIDTPQKTELSVEVCPICGDELTRNGRCKTCYSCGWSSCDL